MGISTSSQSPQAGDSSSPTSRLLMEFKQGRTELLHELVTIASILCVLVQVINHLKPDGRGVFGNLWSEMDYLRELGCVIALCIELIIDCGSLYSVPSRLVNFSISCMVILTIFETMNMQGKIV